MRGYFIACMTLGAWLPACDGSGGGADAAVVDSGVHDVQLDPPDAAAADASPEIGVRCGRAQELCDPVTTSGCCDDPQLGASCTVIGQTFCAGDLTSCDGVEDCVNAEDACCSFSGFGASCTVATDCVARQGGIVVCHHDQECPTEAEHCCENVCTASPCG